MGVGAFRSPEASAHLARLGDVERRVLMGVVDEVIDLLGGDEVASDVWAGLRIETDPVEIPSDSALRRLLPDVSMDAALAAEFRRLTEGDLRAYKVVNLQRLRSAVASACPELVVAADDAPAVAAALTDVRLVLADRLGVRSEDDEEALQRLAVAASAAVGDELGDDGAEIDDEAGTGSDDDGDGPTAGPVAARAFTAAVYGLLGMLQESLVEWMLEALPGDTPGRRCGPR
jgi:hypothetical protein